MKKESNWKEAKKPKINFKISDVLCSVYDSIVDAASNIGASKSYIVSESTFFGNQNCAKSDIRQQLYYLKKRNLIKSVLKNNEYYLEITKEGRDIISWEMIGRHQGKNTGWDKSFRIVMFDVPEDKKSMRDLLRRKLESIGFMQMQKSVFIHPFDCKEDVDSICSHFGASRYVNYLVVKITEGEEEIIEKFLTKNILTLDDLK